jgi:hypothetical protein
MQKQNTNNRFAGLDFGDDSDDMEQKVQQTKTQKKKEERKITEKVVAKPMQKVNASKMAEGGFEVEVAGRQQNTQRGGRGGFEGRGRGGEGRGRGGRGGEGRGGRGRGGADGQAERRPRTAQAPKLDADGNPIKQKEHKKFEGKPRQEEHPFDRRSGTGRGRRPVDKKEGHGKFNTGDKEHVAYKKKGETGEDAPAEEEVKEAKVEAPVPEPEMEIIGFSLDEFMAGNTGVQKL